MSQVKTFEDTEIWKKGREIVNKIYNISDKGSFAKDYVLRNQIRDAALSIISNIAEGFERDGEKEHIQFLSYAKGSAGEVRSQLYIVFDRKYITDKEFKELHGLLMEESKMLSGFMNYMKASGKKGRKNMY